MPQQLESLLSDMRKCTLCAGLPLGPKPIFQLHKDAKILIVGQAPGRITHEKGRPFDDPSGDRLRNWLAIDKSTFYDDPRVGIFPMGLCFPGTGRGGDAPPRTLCADSWRQRVLDHLQNVELTLILGAYAIAWHLPTQRKMSVTQAVWQSLQEDRDIHVLPHPSPRNNRWLRENEWFETRAIPRIQRDIRRVLNS
ncbi:uracil-DNA glycosylase family protein [Roseobacter sp.]|uniref:uracil-DNA glycosylase family protein n=1 Tax=Roseobacter sp. TaxID=1907202 RepID=UPI00385DB935